MELDRLLPATLVAQLPLAPPTVRAAVEALAASEDKAALAAIDALQAALMEDGALTPTAPEAVPYVVALSAAPGLRAATALLSRLARVLAVIDDPPRSLAGQSGSECAREVYDRIEADIPRLLRVATQGRDPARARLAACVAARFPTHDTQVRPVLVALLTGAPDEDEGSRLLYALARIDATAGRALHRRVAEALEGPTDAPERFAALLAIALHDPPEPLRTRCANALREAIVTPRPDPTGFGRTLDGERAGVLLRGLTAPS